MTHLTVEKIRERAAADGCGILAARNALIREDIAKDMAQADSVDALRRAMIRALRTHDARWNDAFARV